MYLRDSAIQIMAQNAYGDYHLSREMLQFILGQHQDLGWEYTQHILGYFNESTANYENTYLTPSADEPVEAYLGCTTIGSEQWNITTDYIYGAFVPDSDTIEAIQAYLRVRAGDCTVTVAICTDVYGKGEVLAEASQSFKNTASDSAWRTFTFDTPVSVTAGQTYYVRIGSVGSPKITMYGYQTTDDDEYRVYVDNGRINAGWRTSYLPNFEVLTDKADTGATAYLGCTELGDEHWNIQNDYIWAPFASDANTVEYIKAYVRVFAGTGTLTAAICTDYYGKGEVVAEATINCNYTENTKGWQTFTFDQPVAIEPGQVYYIRFGSDNVKVTLWGKDSDTAGDAWAEHVDDRRTGSGWSNNRLVNFEVSGGSAPVQSYLGCTELGAEHWNIQNDYIWAPFASDANTVEYIKAYVRVFAGTGTLTAAICTDYYGKGEVVAEATINCNYTENTMGWQTFTFDQPVAIEPGQVYYIRFGSDDVKVTLWGKDSDTANAMWVEHVDDRRTGSGWTNNRLVNFEVSGGSAEQSTVILTLDEDTAGVQMVPVLEDENICALRVILSRDKNATGILKATLSKGYGANATRIDLFETDVEKLPLNGDWVKLSFALPITEVDATQDYSLKLELVNATGKVYWHGTDDLDQHSTYAVVDGRDTLVSGDASFEAYKAGSASFWSKEIQPDGNYMFIHAWYQYATGCIDNEDNRIFIEQSYPVISTYANYYLDNGYIGSNGLIRNPYFEHSREGRKWNAYDLITNVFASQALYEMSQFAAAYGDTASATKWSAAAVALEDAIEQHLVIEYDGVTIYAELYDLDNGTFIPGISWVNLAPMAAEWYAMDPEIMQNTLDLYGVYATDTFYGYEMLHTNGTLGVVKGGVSVIGKGLSWEIMYYNVIGNEARQDYLLEFIETVAAQCGVYPENYRNDRLPDPGNQEHASWQFYAVSYVYPELTKNYAMDQLSAAVADAETIDVSRLREESLGEPLDRVYALCDEAELLLNNEHATKAQVDNLTEELKDALDYLSYVDEAPRAKLIHTGGQTSKMEMTNNTLGLAFSFTLEMDGAAVTGKTTFDSTNATVDVAKNNISYQLVRMGAVVTNNRTVGEDKKSFTLENTNEKNAIDIPAVYLYDLSETDVSYAVRITNIPTYHDQTPIYARPYYVYLFNGEEVVVYGDVYSQSYTPQDSNDVTMDW